MNNHLLRWVVLCVALLANRVRAADESLKIGTARGNTFILPFLHVQQADVVRKNQAITFGDGKKDLRVDYYLKTDGTLLHVESHAKCAKAWKDDLPFIEELWGLNKFVRIVPIDETRDFGRIFGTISAFAQLDKAGEYNLTLIEMDSGGSLWFDQIEGQPSPRRRIYYLLHCYCYTGDLPNRGGKAERCRMLFDDTGKYVRHWISGL